LDERFTPSSYKRQAHTALWLLGSEERYGFTEITGLLEAVGRNEPALLLPPIERAVAGVAEDVGRPPTVEREIREGISPKGPDEGKVAVEGHGRAEEVEGVSIVAVELHHARLLRPRRRDHRQYHCQCTQ
jgi:hypothetical protein